MIETLRKCVQMLPPGVRRRWLLLMPLALATGAAEAGVAAGIFAFVTILSAPGHLLARPKRTSVSGASMTRSPSPSPG